MVTPANYRQVIANFNEMPIDIKNWFQVVPELIQHHDYDVSISYLFARIETIKHLTLYIGLVKLHRLDAALTRSLLEKDHMSRKRFLDLFTLIFDQAVPQGIVSLLAAAEAIRDRAAHGKPFTAAEGRACLTTSFDFMVQFSSFVSSIGGFRPFGDARGFKGAAASLSKETSRWVLKGMGIPAVGAKT